MSSVEVTDTVKEMWQRSVETGFITDDLVQHIIDTEEVTVQIVTTDYVCHYIAGDGTDTTVTVTSNNKHMHNFGDYVNIVNATLEAATSQVKFLIKDFNVEDITGEGEPQTLKITYQCY